MTTYSKIRRVWLVVLLLLAGCAERTVSTVPVGVTSNETAPSAAVKPPPEPTADQKAQAAQFDKFLQDDLSDKEEAGIKAACEKDPKTNLFCFAYVGREQLVQKYKEFRRPDPVKRGPRVRPKFAKGKVTNWDDLRNATIGSLVKSLKRVSLANMKILMAAAIEEPQCPNNTGVAIGALLEDEIPEKITLLEIAQLYEKGGNCQTDPDDKESALTRAGLFYYLNKDLKKAQEILKVSSEIEKARSPRALYWIYQIAKEQSDKPTADSALKKLKEKFPFALHAVLARLAENEDPDDVLTKTETVSMKRSSKVPQANPMLDASELLAQCGHKKAAGKVLDWTIAVAEDAEPEFRLHLAEKKDQDEDLPMRILVLSRLLIEYPQLTSKKTLSLFFPKAFFAMFEKHSAGVDPYLLLAIARQESAFNPKAVSSAKAYGLLQVRPTAKNRRAQLLNPESNVKAGARLFAHLLSRNEGRLHVALAAYNAGPKRSDAWLKRYPTNVPMLFTDIIPYKETRAYIALILRNYYWYRRLHSPLEAKLPWASLNTVDQAYWPGSVSTRKDYR